MVSREDREGFEISGKPMGQPIRTRGRSIADLPGSGIVKLPGDPFKVILKWKHTGGHKYIFVGLIVNPGWNERDTPQEWLFAQPTEVDSDATEQIHPTTIEGIWPQGIPGNSEVDVYKFIVARDQATTQLWIRDFDVWGKLAEDVDRTCYYVAPESWYIDSPESEYF